MNLLRKEEVKIIRDFLELPIPKYVYEYKSEQFDLLDCYEVAFTFANNLLRERKINPHTSPWGGGKSVIFDSCYSDLLLDIQYSHPGTEIADYCCSFLNLLEIFKLHFV